MKKVESIEEVFDQYETELNKLKQLRKDKTLSEIDFLVSVSKLQNITDKRTERHIHTIPHYIKDQAINALYSIGRDDIADRLSKCNQRKKCSLYWCPKCNQTYVDRYRKNLTIHLDKKPESNRTLYHITAPLSLEVDQKGILEVLEEDKKRIRNIGNRLNKFDKYRWVELVYEIEICRPKDIITMGNNYNLNKVGVEHTYKAKHMEALGKIWCKKHKKKHLPNVMYFVHWHGLTNVPIQEASEVFKMDYYIGDERMIKTHPVLGIHYVLLSQWKSLKENLRDITKYPFKPMNRYRHNYPLSDDVNGEYFTMEELGNFIELFVNVVLDNYKIRNTTNRMIRSKNN